MWSNIFHYDNPVWRFIGKFFDIMILNVLWIICSLPVFTIGASTTAVYYVTLKLVRDEEGGTVRSFFKSFRENFRQATAIWLILLVVGVVIAFDLYFFLMMPAERKFRIVMAAVFTGFAILWGGITLFVFPLQARFYNPVKRTLLNACFMSMRHFFPTIGMLVLDIGTVLLALRVAPILQPLLFLFGFPLLAYMNSAVLAGIFERYMPKDAPAASE